ncbi:MAPEG family protein [Aurantiacibacter poecillastricola]|uniref:MAPEG family protein n=1 Tax=Aurantiacibacter poecillastricola TaxID=3064385 RepID=UPI00274013FB|nr:MAPEG family protein [Aurantiacibacter sp. 219JJ12-13]MDP5262259.1 MAPEG family protein [Aurantiacibacter sp. 219JJ12-13]
MDTQILTPAAVLVIWSLVMLMWMARTRFPAMAEAKIRLGERTGGRGQDLEGVLPDHVNWKAHNYTHLMEQPTLFYAVVMILAIAGATLDAVIAAWLYTGIRVVHSIWQATRNTIPVRLRLFQLSTLALAYLAIRALIATL